MRLLFVLTLLVVVATAFGCSSSKSEPVIFLFHYTDWTGVLGIENSLTIKISVPDPKKPDDDAHFGQGAYFTGLKPTTPLEDLLYNNFANLSLVNANKLDYYFNCTFKLGDPHLFQSKKALDYKPKPRDIWLYDIPVKIRDFNCQRGTRPSNNMGKRSVDRLWSASSRAKSMLPKSRFLQT